MLNEKLSGLNKCVTHLTNDTWLGVWENGKTISCSELAQLGQAAHMGHTHQTCQVLTHFLKDKSCRRRTVNDCVCLGLFYLRPVSLMSWYYTFLCVQAGNKSVHVCPFVYSGQDHTWAASRHCVYHNWGKLWKIHLDSQSALVLNPALCDLSSSGPLSHQMWQYVMYWFLTIIYFRIPSSSMCAQVTISTSSPLENL